MTRAMNVIELRDNLTEIIEANKKRGLACRNFNLFPADIKGFSLTEIIQWFSYEEKRALYERASDLLRERDLSYYQKSP